jgi:hypothetical protein
MSDSENEFCDCRECGDIVAATRRWTSEELQVCEDCWWNELDADERREIAQEANR